MDVHFTLGADAFVWDAAKAQLNQRKHGIRFEEAAQVFGDPLLFVVHVEIEDVAIRIISARMADHKEETAYAV